MSNFYLKKTAISFVLLFLSTSFFAQEPHLQLTPVISGLTSPIQVTNAGDASNRLFVVLQQGNANTGVILVYSQSFVKLDTFLIVDNINTGNEEGLLSMAFHPQYGNIASPFYGMFYVYYTNSDGDLQIARYKVSSNPDSADENSKDTVLTISHPVYSNHNGGTIRFGPDGYLYLATGDGAYPPNHAQDANLLLGKLLRIDVNSSGTPPFYSIPPGNPYVGITTPDTLDAIYAFGLRNPFRFSFDKLTNDLWLADVGQGAWEEINFRPAGSIAGVNFGWPCYEGNTTMDPTGCGPMSNYSFPVFTYPNPGSGAAVTGGVVYRGTLPANAALVGYYLATDYYSGDFYKIHPDGNGGWIVYTQPALQNTVANFGEAENGEIFVPAQPYGSVYSITVDAVLPARLIVFTALKVNENVQLSWKTSFEENMSRFEIEYSTDGVSFHHAGFVIATNRTTGAEYSFIHTFSYSGRIFYRLKMINIDNSAEYSAIISIDKAVTETNFVQPSVITTGVINIFLNKSYKTLELINIKGQILIKQNINGRTGRIDIPVSSVPAGTYIVQLRNNESAIQQKVVIR